MLLFLLVVCVVCCVFLTGPEHLRLFAHAVPPGSPAVLPLLAVSMVCPSVGDDGGGGFRAPQRVAQVTRAHAGKVESVAVGGHRRLPLRMVNHIVARSWGVGSGPAPSSVPPSLPFLVCFCSLSW